MRRRKGQAARICEVGAGIKEYQADSGRWTVSALEAAGVEFTTASVKEYG